MDLKQLTPELSVAAQISSDDLQKIAEAGFKSVICNRPDNEGADQTSFASIAAEAKKLGLEAAYLPVISGKVTNEEGVSFDQLVHSMPTPILAYCRTGTRSATLWTLAEQARAVSKNA